jgi:hypothetical protein
MALRLIYYIINVINRARRLLTWPTVPMTATMAGGSRFAVRRTSFPVDNMFSPFEDDDRSNIQYGDDGLDMDNESLQSIYCGHAEEYERHGQPEFHGTSYMIGSVSSPDAVSSPSTPTARQKAFSTRMHVRDQKHTVSHFTLVTYIQLHFTL